MNLIKVSVIMPAYNTEEYIEEAIQSVQNQTFQDWELLIIDDGSPDNLVEIVTRFANTDSRIHLIRQKNSGVSVARNTGIKKAKGEYISFLDSDDYWAPDFLEKTYTKANKHNLDFIYTGFQKQRPDGTFKHIGKPYIEINLLEARIFEQQSIFIGTFLVRHDFLLTKLINFMPNCKYAEDVEFLLKILCFSTNGVIPESLAYYRYRPQSAQRSGWNKNREDVLKVYDRLRIFFEKNHSTDSLPSFTAQLQKSSASHLYRLLWGAVSLGEFDVASDLIIRYPYLIQSGTKKWTHTLKLKIVASKNPFIWKIIHLISK